MRYGYGVYVYDDACNVEDVYGDVVSQVLVYGDVVSQVLSLIRLD